MCLRVNSCCGCADLAKGCRIIAWMGIIFSAMAAVQALVQANLPNLVVHLIMAVVRYASSH